MRIRHLIFDWSGTLVDDLPPVWKTTNHVLRRCGLPEVTLDELRREFCLPIRKYYERRVPNVPQATLERIFIAEYRAHHHEIQLLPHTLDFLRFAREHGWNLFIASTVDQQTYETQMARFGIGEFITKPYVGIVDKTVTIHDILEENQLAPDATLFVGDMEHDIEAGKAGGVRTCAVLTGYNHAAKLRAMQPDLVCEHLGELQEILAGNLTTATN